MYLSRAALRRVVALSVAIATLAFVTGARTHAAAQTAFEPFEASGTTRVAIPAAFDLPAADSGLRLATVVTTDFDSDGDLDVIASDGATHLFVWINDGAGHLTRKSPLPTNDQEPTTSTPSIAERPATAIVSIQPAGAVAVSNDQRVWIAIAGRAFRPRGSPDSSSAVRGSLGSRAPPALPLFV